MQIDFIYNPVFTQTDSFQYSDSNTALFIITSYDTSSIFASHN